MIEIYMIFDFLEEICFVPYVDCDCDCDSDRLCIYVFDLVVDLWV
jgi:hypothetical protein